MATPTLGLVFNPSGPTFAISEACVMPEITVTAVLQNAPPGAVLTGPVDWSVQLQFVGGAGSAANCSHCAGVTVSHTPISATTTAPSFKIPFTQVRGGDLTVQASAWVGSNRLTAKSAGLQVVGTNPTVGSLSALSPAIDAFRKLVRLESALQQFRSPSCPKWSADNYHGVGLCQLTPYNSSDNVAPTFTGDDNVWNWKANLQGGIKVYNTKQKVARNYPGRVRKGDFAADLSTGATFATLVQSYNAARTAAGQPPLTITLPDFDDEQLQRDTLRGYNGFAGGLHEYRVQLTDDGELDLVVSGAAGTAQWRLVTPAMRTAYYDSIGQDKKKRGDPNYVEDVLKQPTY